MQRQIKGQRNYLEMAGNFTLSELLKKGSNRNPTITVRPKMIQKGDTITI